MSETKRPPILIDVPESFASERLTIRAPRPGDGAALCEAVNETLPLLKPWMHWAQEPMTPEGAEENVRRAHTAYLLRQDLRLNLYLKGTDTLIGCSGLHRIDWEVPRFEIGYWCRTSQQGRGYITEAVEATAQMALTTLGAQRLELHIASTNERSLRIPQWTGFTREACLRRYLRTPDGTLHDMIVFTRYPKE